MSEAAPETTTMDKAFWRVIPYMLFLNVISYLGRANIGYAAPQITRELASASGAFGFAAAIGYFLFEVPNRDEPQDAGTEGSEAHA